MDNEERYQRLRTIVAAQGGKLTRGFSNSDGWHYQIGFGEFRYLFFKSLSEVEHWTGKALSATEPPPYPVREES